MYKILDKIVISDTVPRNTEVLWLKPIGNGYALYIYNNGVWGPLEIVDTHGSTSPDDDTVIDVENIPSLDTLEDKIEGEVTKQMADHDVKAHDVHYEHSEDGNEYPDYGSIIG